MDNVTDTVQATYNVGKMMGIEESRLIIQMITQQVIIRDYFEERDKDNTPRNGEELLHARDVLAEISRRFSPFHEWNEVDSHIVCSGCGVSVKSYNKPCE